jgi:hypothetical protein
LDTLTTDRVAFFFFNDTATTEIYTLTAEYGPAPAAKEGQKAPRPQPLPDSFHVLVIGK